MCSHGKTKLCTIKIPAHLSHTRAERWDSKPVDSCIADLVEELNRCGEYTSGSCCGHRKGPGSIIFHDGRELTIRQAEGLLLDHGFVIAKYLHAADPAKRAGVQSAYYPERDKFRGTDPLPKTPTPSHREPGGGG